MHMCCVWFAAPQTACAHSWGCSPRVHGLLLLDAGYRNGAQGTYLPCVLSDHPTNAQATLSQCFKSLLSEVGQTNLKKMSLRTLWSQQRSHQVMHQVTCAVLIWISDKCVTCLTVQCIASPSLFACCLYYIKYQFPAGWLSIWDASAPLLTLKSNCI